MARPGFWDALWISPSQDPREDIGAFVFRTKLTLDSVPKSMVVRVSADQRYRLYVNGVQVSFGPQRGDLFHWFYDSIDIASNLRAGENIIHAIVWNYDRYAPMSQFSARTGFIFDSPVLKTPGNWQCARIPGYSFDMLTNHNTISYSYVGPGDIINGRYSDWASLGDDDTLPWRKPNHIGEGKEQGSGGGDSMWWLTSRTLPAMRYEKTSQNPQIIENGQRVAWKPLELIAGSKVVLDFGELLCAYPEVVIKAPADGSVLVSYAESLYIHGTYSKGNRNSVEGKEFSGNSDRFEFVAGRNQFEPLWWRTFRYVEIQASANCTIESFRPIETGYPIEPRAKFENPNPLTPKIWEVGLRTVRRCAGENYFDCPYYEQLQYEGDTRIQALVGYYLSTDRRLQRNAVNQFAWSQLAFGLTQSRYPSREPQVIPGFSLYWIMMLWDQWLYDDLPLNPKHLQIARDIIACWHHELLPNPKRSYWTFADWVESWPGGEPPGGSQSIVHLLTLLLAEIHLARMESGIVVGDFPGRERSQARLAEYVVKPNGLISHPIDSSGLESEHAEAMYRLCQKALGLKMAPWPKTPMQAKATYYYQFYTHLAQETDDYESFLDPWREQIDMGLTTFLESREPSRSDCHAWSAHPLLGYFQRIAGVTSIAPGWSKCRIAPKPGPTGEFKATIPHPKGLIKVEVKNGQPIVECPVPYDLIWDEKTK